MSTLRVLAAFVAAFLLASCGGGGGGSAPADDVQTGTGSQPPQETVADISARIPGLLARSDSYLASAWYIETDSPDLQTFRAGSSCTGTECTFYEPETGVSLTLGLDDVDVDTSRSRPILTKNGITVLDTPARRTGDVTDGRTLTAVLDHSAFGSTWFRSAAGDLMLTSWLSTAGGDLTDTKPTRSATWTGLMLGVADGTNLLQGDAALTYDFAGSIDASFTGIRNITRNRAHSVSTVRFDDIPVSSRGDFDAGGAGNYILGSFYGPGHAEAAGVFEQQGIVGAFGAKR